MFEPDIDMFWNPDITGPKFWKWLG